MALDDLSELDRYRRRSAFPPGWDDDHDWGRVFFAPEDNLDGALYEMVRSAQDSLFIALRSLDPRSFLFASLVSKTDDERCHVQITVGSGVPPGEGFAVGSPELIIQAAVVDATDVVTGSADWSTGLTSGDLLVVRDPAWAALYLASLSALHTYVREKGNAHE